MQQYVQRGGDTTSHDGSVNGITSATTNIGHDGVSLENKSMANNCRKTNLASDRGKVFYS